MYKICVWDLFSTLVTALNWALPDDRQFITMRQSQVPFGGLPGQLHCENCMAIGTTSPSTCGAYHLSTDCVLPQSEMQPGNLFSIFLVLYEFLRRYKFCLCRPIVRYYKYKFIASSDHTRWYGSCQVLKANLYLTLQNKIIINRPGSI